MYDWIHEKIDQSSQIFPTINHTKICSAHVCHKKQLYIHKTVFNTITTHYEPPRNHKIHQCSVPGEGKNVVDSDTSNAKSGLIDHVAEGADVREGATLVVGLDNKTQKGAVNTEIKVAIYMRTQ